MKSLKKLICCAYCSGFNIEGNGYHDTHCIYHIPFKLVTTMIKNHNFDPVNKPAHYNQGKAKCNACAHPIECIDITRHMDFALGNAMKYIWRFREKNGLQDLMKARWYLEDAIKQIENNPEEEKKGNTELCPQCSHPLEKQGCDMFCNFCSNFIKGKD